MFSLAASSLFGKKQADLQWQSREMSLKRKKLSPSNIFKVVQCLISLLSALNFLQLDILSTNWNMGKNKLLN